MMVLSLGTDSKLITLIQQEKIANFSLKMEKLAVNLNKPFIKTSEAFSGVYFSKWDQKNLSLDSVKNISKLALAILCLPLTALAYGLAGSIDLLNFSFFNKKGFSFISHEKSLTENANDRSILSLNACMLWGCLPSFFGGVDPASYRLNKLKSLILENKPDVVFLQEVSRDISVDLIEELKKTIAFLLAVYRHSRSY